VARGGLGGDKIVGGGVVDVGEIVRGAVVTRWDCWVAIMVEWYCLVVPGLGRFRNSRQRQRKETEQGKKGAGRKQGKIGVNHYNIGRWCSGLSIALLG